MLTRKGSSDTSSVTSESIGSLVDFIVDDTEDELEQPIAPTNPQDCLEIVDYIMLALNDLRLIIANRMGENAAIEKK